MRTNFCERTLGRPCARVLWMTMITLSPTQELTDSTWRRRNYIGREVLWYIASAIDVEVLNSSYPVMKPQVCYFKSAQAHYKHRNAGRISTYIRCKHVPPSQHCFISRVDGHGIVAVKTHVLRLQGNTTPSTRQELPPNLRSNARVTMGQQ